MSAPIRRICWRLCVLAAVAVAMALGVAGYFALAASPEKPPAVTLPPAAPEASTEQVQEFCSACHAVPPPDSFPRSAWRKQVRQAYDFFRDSPLKMDYPSIESIAAYYENRAPEELPPLDKGLA